jgi:hypothetical protein
MEPSKPPRVFISYSWESEDHKSWVRYLGERLRRDGIEARLDQWVVQPGESFTAFMEQEVAAADFVVVVCTPSYARKSNDRQGGVGYEQQIVSGRLMSGTARSKFIPILRKGNDKPGSDCAIPTHFLGISWIEFRDDEAFEKSLEDLIRAIFSEPKFAPPSLGARPSLETITTTSLNRIRLTDADENREHPDSNIEKDDNVKTYLKIRGPSTQLGGESMSRSDAWSVVVALFVAGVALFVGTTQAAIAAILAGVALAVVLWFRRTDDKGKEALAATTKSLSAGLLGGIVGVVALGSWFIALASGFGGFALPFFFITSHVLFKFGLRFIHPAFYRTKIRFYMDREVLTFLYSLPCALFAFSLPFGPLLESFLTGRFLLRADVPSTGMPTRTQFLIVEVILGLLFVVGCYGFGMAMILEEFENVKSSTIDTIIVGAGQGILILAMAVFAHRFTGFNHTPHIITKEELANCFLFSGLLAGAVFNSYRLRRSYGQRA